MMSIKKKFLRNIFKLSKNLQYRQLILKFITKLDDLNFNESRIIMEKYYNIKIGVKSYGCYKINGSIEPGTIIGSYCSFAPGVVIGGMNHPLHLVSTHPILYNKKYDIINENKESYIKQGTKKVIVEDDVWLGRNVIVNAGVTIGKGAVVASGAVVTKNVEPYTIVGGVPAKIIGKRFNDKQIEELIRINWFGWDDQCMKENIEYFYDIDSFIERFSIK